MMPIRWSAILLCLLLCAATAAAEPGLEPVRRSWLRGETAEFKLLEGPLPRGTRIIVRGTSVPGAWQPRPDDDNVVRVETGPMRVGDYEISVRRGKAVLAAVPFYVRPAERPKVWFGNFIARPMRGGEDPMKELAELKMNGAYSYSTDPDEALRHGIYLVHHGNGIRSVPRLAGKEKAKSLMQVFMNCKGTTKPTQSPCLRNPEVIKLAGDKLVADMQKLHHHPAYMGVGFDDEISARHYDWNDTGGVTCYCDSCRRQWKQKTGQDLPVPLCAKPGAIVPDDQPYLKYMLEWTGWGDYYGPAEANYSRQVHKRIKRLDPTLVTLQTPGAAFGELDVVHWEIYSYWFSSPPTAALGDMSFCHATQRVTDDPVKPIWPLIGWYQRTPAPDWTGPYLAAQSRMCMAEGAHSLWFTVMYWYRSRGGHKPELFYGAEHVKPYVQQIGTLLERYGPCLQEVKPVRYPVAVLFSRTTLGLMRVIDPADIAEAKSRGSWLERAWEHGQATSMGFGALLKAGVPCEFITETDITADRLGRYGAVVLLDNKYARRSVIDKLQAFAGNGGLVFADAASPAKPEAASGMPIDSSQVTQMINLGLRAARVGGKQLEITMDRMTGLEDEWAFKLRPWVKKTLPDKLRVTTSSNPDVIVRMGEHGKTRYVFVVSTDVKQAQSADITARCGGRYAYELEAGRREARAVFDGVLSTRVTIEPGQWTAFVVTDRPVQNTTVTAVNKDGAVLVSSTVTGPDGNPIDGSFPVHLEVLDSKGNALPYGAYLGTRAGALTHRFIPADNDPAGAWTIRATNLVTGSRAETTVKAK